MKKVFSKILVLVVSVLLSVVMLSNKVYADVIADGPSIPDVDSKPIVILIFVFSIVIAVGSAVALFFFIKNNDSNKYVNNVEPKEAYGASFGSQPTNNINQNQNTNINIDQSNDIK